MFKKSPKPKENARRWTSLISLCLASLVCWTPLECRAEGKIALGLVEDIMLMPWRIKLPARIDTGATTSSLDARELRIKDNMAEFRLPKEYGGKELRLPVVGWKTVRSAEAKEKRPVVEIDLCIGSKYLRTRVNLNDRSQVKFPMLIGRNILKENFSVDCNRSHCAPPTCPEMNLK
jgi:hypothetical protein